MEKTLTDHIGRLEEKIVALKRELQADNLTPFEREERELAIANAQEAIRLFCMAYELEKNV